MSKMRLPASALAKGLRQAALVRPWQRDDRTPALVRLHVSPSSCTIISSDFARQIEVTIACEAEQSFTTVAPLNTLSAFVDKSKAGSVLELTATDDGIRAIAGRSRVTLTGRAMDASPMKEPPDTERATIAASALAAGLLAAAPATLVDAARPHLGGVFIHSAGGKLSFAAQDGARIHVAAQDGARIGDRSYLIPSKSAALIAAAFAEDASVDVFADERTLWAETQGVRVAAGLMTTQFPSVDALMASPTDRVLTGHADQMLADIDVVMAVSNHRDRDFRLDLGSDCEASTFRVADGGYEAGANGIRAVFVGAPLAIGFQFPLVRDALALFGSSEVQWRMAGPEQPTLITSSDHPGVEAMVSPFRLAADHQRKAA